MADDEAYLRTALPVLAAYTRQVVLEVDVERLRAAARHAGTADHLAFLDALAAFAAAVRGLRVDGEAFR